MASLVQAPGSRLANFFAFRRDPLEFMVRMSNVGDLVALSSARTAPSFVVNDPECVQELLVAKERHLRKGRSSRILAETLGSGLLTTEGQQHATQRKLVQPAFHMQQIARQAQAIVALAQSAVHDWLQDSPDRAVVRPLSEDLMELTLRVITASMFGDAIDERAGQLGAAVDVCIRHSARRLYAPVPLSLKVPTPAHRRFARALTDLDRYLDECMDADRDNLDANRGATLLSMLLDLRTEAGASWLTREQVRDQLLTIFIAGHETTANALSWALYLLCLYPDVQEQWHEELDAVLAGATPAFADVARLPLTQRIFQESLRLYPTAWMILREAVEPVAIGGHEFAANSTFLISPFAIHRSAQWWDEPLAFRPERFAGERFKGLPRYVYFPFGGGSRSCVGSQFAQMEAVLILAVLGQALRFELPTPDARVEPEPSVSLRVSGGLKLRMVRRNRSL